MGILLGRRRGRRERGADEDDINIIVKFPDVIIKCHNLELSLTSFLGSSILLYSGFL